MPRGNYSPNPELLNLLMTFGHTEYYVKEVRDKFRELYRQDADLAELRRWIYGQFRTLIKHGYIVCNEKSEATNSFKNTSKITAELGNNSGDEDLESSQFRLSELKKRMNTLKLELMHCDGEVKEYEELNGLFPDLGDTIKVVYTAVKARHVELVGRVNAIESIIKRICNPA